MTALLALLAALQAAPPAAPAPSNATTVATVTVTAERQAKTQAERIRGFVAAVGIPSGYDQLARWQGDDVLCVRTAGFQAGAAAAIQAAIEGEAKRLRLPVGGHGCDVDVLVVGSDDPPRIMDAIQRRSGALWGHGGPAAMDREIARPAPVHWWRVVATAPADGSKGIGGGAGGGAGALGPPVFNGFELTHLHKMTRETIASVVVLVDSRRIAGVTAPALADYVAMGVFAPVPSPPKPTDAPSILRLFRPEGGVEPSAPAGFSDWDLAYLQGLYDADPSEASLLQEGRIQVTLQRALASAPAPAR